MSHPPTTVLVTGPSGAVGPVLVNALLREGHRVRVLSRHDAPRDVFQSPIEAIVGDVAGPHSVERAIAGTTTVFHLAAKLHVPNPPEHMRAEYERVNVDGTGVLVEAARAAGVHRLIFFSTVSVYGPTGLVPVDETATPHPDTVYAETKLRAEQIVLAAKNVDGEPLGVVLRMAAVYGPRMKGNYLALVNSLAKRRFLPVGNGSNLRTLVYDRDAVRAAILAALHPGAAGRIYNVSDGTVHCLRDIIGAICAALGRRPPRLFVPLHATRLAAALADRVIPITGRSARLLPAVDKFVESAAVRADRIQHELGFRPEYDLKRGWQETVAAMAGRENTRRQE